MSAGVPGCGTLEGMALTLPLGIRVAAGLLGTAIDRLGTLPGELPGLVVSAAGQALRTSMRVRQEIAELATRGDDLLAPLTGRSQEHPPWATFDEDDDEPPTPGRSTRSGAGTDTAEDDPWTAGRPVVQPDSVAGAGGPAQRIVEDDRTGSVPDLSAPIGVTPLAAMEGPDAQRELAEPGLAEAGLTTAAFVVGTGAAPEVTLAGREPGDVVSTAAGAGVAATDTIPVTGGDRTDSDVVAESTASTDPVDLVDGSGDAGDQTSVFGGAVSGGPASARSTTPRARNTRATIKSDHQLTIAELKERLQGMDVAAVRALLAQEETGPNRAAYLTLLGNRLMTLQHDDR